MVFVSSFLFCLLVLRSLQGYGVEDGECRYAKKDEVSVKHMVVDITKSANRGSNNLGTVF